MKRTMKTLICLLLCIAIIFSFTACNLLSGNTRYDDVYTELWVETLDEMLYIIERTRSYGTEISQLPTFDCEEYGIDVKFMITISKDLYDSLEEGELYYERYLSEFYLESYIFFENVTIEEAENLGGDVVYRFECAYTQERNKHRLADKPNEDDEVSVKAHMDTETNSYDQYVFYYNEHAQFGIKLGRSLDAISEEDLEILKQTIYIIE